MTSPNESLFTARSYRGTTDLARILHFIADLRQSLPDGLAPHPGMLLWHAFQMHGDYDPARLLHLWEAQDGSLAGYVLLYRNFAGFDWQVLPALRGTAIEQAMLTWATTALASAGCTFVHEHDVQRLALLKTLGYRPGDGWVQMVRDLAHPNPPPILPSGFTIRSMVSVADAAERARVLAAADGDSVHADRYRKFMATPGYERELDLVVVAEDGRFAAFVTGWLDATGQVGLFEPVGTDPAFRRRGLAKAVLCEGLLRLQQRGAKRVTLSTGIDDTGPIQLYQSVGFVASHHTYLYQQT